MLFCFVNRKLEVQLPRFLLERSYSLRDVLQTLDVTQVFQDDADIVNMGESKGPKLTQVSYETIVSGFLLFLLLLLLFRFLKQKRILNLFVTVKTQQLVIMMSSNSPVHAEDISLSRILKCRIRSS